VVQTVLCAAEYLSKILALTDRFIYHSPNA
jgi:hypothetical protein